MSVEAARTRPARAAGQVAGALRERLAAAWPGARVVKTALAVGLAWAAGQALGQELPVFAALAALQALRPTIADSLRHTGGQLVGMTVGGALAALTLPYFGVPSALQVGLIVFVALLATIALRATRLMGAEVAVTALLVLFYSSRQQPLFAFERLWEAALGGAIALAVNALVLPPDYSRDLREAVDALVGSLIEHLSVAVEDLLQHPPPGAARAHLVAVRAAVREAAELRDASKTVRESLRFSPVLRRSPWRRGQVARMERQLAGVDPLAAALPHARTAMRAAWQASRLLPPAIADAAAWHALLAAVIEAIARYEAWLASGAPAAATAARVAVATGQTAHAQLLAESPAAAPGSWEMERATVLSELGHVLDDLAGGLASPPRHLPATAPPAAVG